MLLLFFLFFFNLNDKSEYPCPRLAQACHTGFFHDLMFGSSVVGKPDASCVWHQNTALPAKHGMMETWAGRSARPLNIFFLGPGTEVSFSGLAYLSVYISRVKNSLY